MKPTPYLLVIAALALSLPAWADHHGHEGAGCQQHDALLKNADTDHDGSIDKAEFQALQNKRFAEMDTNGDGQLSQEELAAAQNAWHQQGSRGFQKADKNNDGTLDREEAKTLPKISQHFDEIDTDKDGTLDREEVHRFMKAQRAH